MYKKILAVVLSTMMFAQAVSAATLHDFVSTKFPPSVLTDDGTGVFDYGKVKANAEKGIPGEVETEVEALVAVSGSGDYQKKAVSTSNKFDFKVTLKMDNVRKEIEALYPFTHSTIAGVAGAAAEYDAVKLEEQFDLSYVKGAFEVTVTIPDELQEFELSDFVLMQNGAPSTTFVGGGTETATGAVFNFKVADGINVKTLYDQRNTMLADLYIEATATATAKNEDLSVTAGLTYAKVDFVDDEVVYGFMNFISNEDTATVRLTKASHGKDGLPEDKEDEPEVPPVVIEAPSAHLVLTDSDIEVEVIEDDGEYFVDVDSIDVPEKEGFVLEGLYLDPTFTKPATGMIQIYEDIKLYPKYINISAPGGFISDEHILYIVGYPDGEVKPNNNITREEVVAALYRLLKPEFKADLDTSYCQFPDVDENRWSYESIAAFANAGYVVGDLEGMFNPGMPITRAEFVTIINKFAPEAEQHSGSHFTDISGHWAEKFIVSSAVDWSWVTGYEDNTFRPNSRITRAEAVTIINKMLVRYGDVESDLATQWPDLNKSDWYYGAMIEATTEHNYTRNANGWSETWVR